MNCSAVPFDCLAHGETKTCARFELMPHAPAGNRHSLEMLVAIHIAHGHQSAVFQFERGFAMRAAFHAHFVGDFRDQMSEPDIAGIRVRHVLDEMRQFVARINTFETRRAIDVVLAIDEPMHVEHDNRIHAQLTATPADFMVTVDSGLTATLMRTVELGQI